jgi:hypothetical protein
MKNKQRAIGILMVLGAIVVLLATWNQPIDLEVRSQE